MKNIRFIPLGDSRVEIRAKLKATGKFATFGFCHAATVPLIKRDGIKPHITIITIQ